MTRCPVMKHDASGTSNKLGTKEICDVFRSTDITNGLKRSLIRADCRKEVGELYLKFI